MLRAIARSLTSSPRSLDSHPHAHLDNDPDLPPRSRRHRSRLLRSKSNDATTATAALVKQPSERQQFTSPAPSCRDPAVIVDDTSRALIPASDLSTPPVSDGLSQSVPELPPRSNHLNTKLNNSSRPQRPPLPTWDQPANDCARESATADLLAGLPPVPGSNRDETGLAMLIKVWVKRPGASATRVEVNDDDLVDNVRDVILRKYANSLGRSIDSPDISLKIVSREQANRTTPTERILSPEENIRKTLDTYYPGGQAIDEALVIEVPQRKTPRPSPRPGNHLQYYVSDEYRPGDTARDYFPPMPLQSPHLGHVQHQTLANGVQMPVHSMSVLTTGQLPTLPSPGGHSTRRFARPKFGRQHTSSPTIIHSTQTSHASGVDPKSQANGPVSSAPPLPTPPAQVDHKNTVTPPNRTTSPHPNRARKKKPPNTAASMNGDVPLPSKPASAGLLDGRVPPINVLIVEDNVINLRLLEQFMKRLKVRWKTAMNGREAVDVWRTGGFHLVLMDIQLPIMNGLQATKEIRRLEGANGIGLSVFGDTSPHSQRNGHGELKDEDKLDDRNLFKSPVIIVALTASSLQSDRHEALAVGCNDFLTKPVTFGWMERKVTEWGCMQALIDFDGWRKWKEIEAKKASSLDPEKQKQEEKEEKARARAALKAAMSKGPVLPTKTPTATTTGAAPTVQQIDTGSPAMNSSSSEISPSAPTNPTRRTHKGSRSSGNVGMSLPSTMEVDE